MTRKAMLCVALLGMAACDAIDTADKKQTRQQEQILSEAMSQVGMPAIKNFRERRQLKDIYEMRDQEGLATYTYVFAEMTGKLAFFCNSIGFGIPAATQFTAPERPAQSYETHESGNIALPQADPNGLFSPQSAEGTWVTCLGPDKEQHPVYVEPRVIVSPFKLEQ